MKKLITTLSLLTVTSSILPLTVACKTRSKSSNPGSKSETYEKTDEDKIKDANYILLTFRNIETNEANTDQLKDLIKSKIEHGLNKKDGITVESAMKITRKDETADLRNSDITTNEIDITITGQFKSGSLTKSFTLNTKVKLNFTRGLDINEITADMIINWKKTYTVEVEDPYYIYETEKLETLPNKAIELVIKNNLRQIIQNKISGIDNTEFNDHIINEAAHYSFNELNETEKLNIAIANFIFDHLITCKVEHQNELHAKKFIAKIRVKKWNEANKNNELQNLLYQDQATSQEFLDLSKKNKEGKVLEDRFDPEKINKLLWMKNDQETIEQEINNRIKISKTILKITLDSVESMYNRIKGTNTTIEIDISDKQQLNFTRGIDINEITADMIINWKKYYVFEYKDLYFKNTREELKRKQDKWCVENTIKNSILQIIQHKISGINKTKLEDYFINDIFHYNIREWNAKEISGYLISRFIVINLINLSAEFENVQNVEKVTASIEVKKWNETKAEINDKFENWFKNIHKDAKLFLNLTYEKKEEWVKDHNPLMTLDPDQVKAEINFWSNYFNSVQQVNLDSVKSMYDLIKGTNKTIEINLTDKQ